MAIPMLDIPAMHAPFRRDLLDKMAEVLDSAAYIGGKYVAAFEEELAEYVGAKRAVGVSSGSDALIVALMGLGVEPGDEIITSSFTFFATVGAIVRLGAKPVFVDIDPVTFNTAADRIEAAVTERTVGVLPVHLFGQSADMDPINAVAEKRGLWVCEDAAQAIGALYHGRMCGTMGTLGTYSFFPAKNLGCCGDGGAVVTDDEDLGERVNVLKNHGSKPKYYHRLVGGNFRLDGLQAALLSVKLPHLKTWEAQRRGAAARYAELLADSPLFVTPVEVPGCYHVYNQYELRVLDGRRDAVHEKLKEAGVGCAIYYPVPLHLQECFADLGYKKGDLPETEKACDEVIAVPILVEPSVCDEVVQVLTSA